jgi:hypothetical protein
MAKKATGDDDVPGDTLNVLGEDNLKHDWSTTYVEV